MLLIGLQLQERTYDIGPVSLITLHTHSKRLLLPDSEVLPRIDPNLCATIEQNREEIVGHFHDIVLLVTQRREQIKKCPSMRPRQ